GLARPLLGAGCDDDHVGIGAHGDIGGALDRGRPDELETMAKVQYLRPHLVVVEVVEGEVIGQTLVESSKSDGGPDAAGANDGEVPHPLSMSVSGGLLTVGEVGIGDSSDDYP